MEECYAKSQLEYNFYLGVVELLTKWWPSLLFRIWTYIYTLQGIIDLLFCLHRWYLLVTVDIHPSSNYMMIMGGHEFQIIIILSFMPLQYLPIPTVAGYPIVWSKKNYIRSTVHNDVLSNIWQNIFMFLFVVPFKHLASI